MTKRIVSGVFILVALGALGLILAGALTSGEQLIVRFLTAIIVAALGLYVISDLRLQADDEAAAAGKPRPAGSGANGSPSPPANSTAAFMATVTGKRSILTTTEFEGTVWAQPSDGSGVTTQAEPAGEPDVAADLDPAELDLPDPEGPSRRSEPDGAGSAVAGEPAVRLSSEVIPPYAGGGSGGGGGGRRVNGHPRPLDAVHRQATPDLDEPSPYDKEKVPAWPLTPDGTPVDDSPCVDLDDNEIDGLVRMFARKSEQELARRAEEHKAGGVAGGQAVAGESTDDGGDDTDDGGETTAAEPGPDLAATAAAEARMASEPPTPGGGSGAGSGLEGADEARGADPVTVAGTAGAERDTEPAATDRVGTERTGTELVAIDATDATQAANDAGDADDAGDEARVAATQPAPITGGRDRDASTLGFYDPSLRGSVARIEAAAYARPSIAPIIDLRSRSASATDIESAIQSGELQIISSLIEQGVLSTEGPISDRDVRTMVYVAFTSNELRKILLAGGTIDGDNTGLDLGPIELFHPQPTLPTLPAAGTDLSINLRDQHGRGTQAL